MVYVDNDPMVLVHGRALLAENGNTAVITADFCEPDEVLNNPDLRALIDFDRPVGLLMVAVLHHLDDASAPTSWLRAIGTRSLPAASYSLPISSTVATRPPRSNG